MPNRFRPRPSINFCRTPEGLSGECSDVRKCMWLMFNVEKLRQSVCLRNLVVPGVCCPSATIPMPAPPPVPPPAAPLQPAPFSPVSSNVGQPQQSLNPAASNLNKKPIPGPALNPPVLTKPVKAPSALTSVPTNRPIFHSQTTTSTTPPPPPVVTKRPSHSWIQEVPFPAISGHSLSGQAIDSNDLYNKTATENRGETDCTNRTHMYL